MATQPGDDFMDAQWNAGRSNISWVFENGGAKSTFCSCMGQSASRARYPCILHAQKHNPNAQATITAYGPDRTERYVDSLGNASHCV